MRYGRAIKESVLKRVLPPNAESIRSVSVDVRIAEQTIRNWIAKVDQGILGDDVQLGPRQLGAPEKFALLLEAAGLKEDERGPWIREKGLHTEHLQLWQQELRDTVAEKSNKDKQDLKDAKKRIKELEKELNRKDKALAEMAALVALKKKTPSHLGGQRGRLIPQGSKETVIEAIDTAVRAGARQTRACEIVGITPRTLQNWHRGGTEDKRKGAQKNVVRKLSDEEREQILSLCTSERFKDMTPHEIVAILAQESSYLASESTMYRVLRARNMVHHRGNTRPKRTVSKPPQVVATGPNQVFSWDITWLHTSVRGIFLFAYVIIDIFDRTIVGWEVHDREDEQLARDLFARLSKRLNLKGAHVHSDNGNPMKGLSLLGLLYTLGVSNSYSRPRVSNDNPFIETFFKTLKYSTKYPGRFEDIHQARDWFAAFVHWYNMQHLHSALGYVTPAQRRAGEDKILFKKRNQTIEKARERYPQRWGSRKPRAWKASPTVILNPDKNNDMDEQPAQKAG
jgi:putative transposase